MKIISLIMVAGFSRVHNNQIINFNTIYSASKMNNTNYVIAINLHKRKRVMQMIFNEYNNAGYYKCYFCNGRGYVPCTKCKNYLCIDCENTGYKPCNICRGDGSGGPRPRSFPLLTYSHENMLPV